MCLLRNIFSILTFFSLSLLDISLFLFVLSQLSFLCIYLFLFSIKFDYITTSSILSISSNTLYVERIKTNHINIPVVNNTLPMSYS